MTIRRNLAVAAVATLTVTGVGATAGTAAGAPPGGSPAGTYIVTVDEGTLPAQAADRAARLGGRIEHVYTSALKGFAVRLPAGLAQRLSTLPGVVEVERDVPMHASTLQAGATWGLDRTDQASRKLNGSYGYDATGAGVTAYVIDTGIRFSHTDFAGRAVSGYDAVDGGIADDCNGHGTHVAGTVGGSKYGVAKEVALVAVRVLDCAGNGTTAGVIAGVDWVTADHEVRGGPAVANMSLGGGVSTALDDAVADSIDAGVTYAVAAGNGNSRGVPLDACTSSPARVSGALTVGASDKTDAPASFSNYGACVDLFAPGVGITSDWYTTSYATNTISGTSMATPHVAGVAALLLETNTLLETNSAAGPSTVHSAITTLATRDAVRTTRTANNDLLFSNY